jgi:hypothetical protein
MLERSSAKRKELFRMVQVEKMVEKAKVVVGKAKQVIEHTKQLIIDMPVRWSSTYAMLHQAEQLSEVSIHTSAIVVNIHFSSP